MLKVLPIILLLVICETDYWVFPELVMFICVYHVDIEHGAVPSLPEAVEVVSTKGEQDWYVLLPVKICTETNFMYVKL